MISRNRIAGGCKVTEFVDVADNRQLEGDRLVQFAMDSPPLTPPIPTVLQRLQHGLSTFEFVHLPHDRWPLHRSGTVHKSPKIHVSVLDSSFNPPTLAHLALANAPLPRPSISPDVLRGSDPLSNQEILPHDYDAKLLLLSIRNADKSLKPNDATYHQRLEMVVRLAQDVVGYDSNGQPTADVNVAVAAIDEPRFVDKSRLLLTFLRRRLTDLCAMPHLPSSDLPPSSPDQPPAIPTPHLIFLQGLDTLGRLFSPQYYKSEDIMTQELCRFFSEDGDGSRVVCARRVQRTTNSQSDAVDDFDERDRVTLAQAERQILTKIPIRKHVDSGRITLVDIGRDERTFSSTEIRHKIQCGDDSWKAMTTPHVIDYILKHNLYTGPRSPT